MDTLIDLATIYLAMKIIMGVVAIFVGIPIFISVVRQLTKKKKINNQKFIN